LCVVYGPKAAQFRTHHSAIDSTALLGRKVKVIFAGGLSCEGREQDMPISAWQVICLSQKLPLIDGEPPSTELPEALFGAQPVRVAVSVPGWNAAEIALPPLDEKGGCSVQEPIILRRKLADLALSMPAAGTDYETAEVVWVHSLEEEPLALPLGRNTFIPLDFKGAKRLVLPTGVYRCTLKGRNVARVRDFDLITALVLHARGERSAVVSLPPSLSRTFVGFAGSAVDPQSPDGPTGFFCGIDLNLRKNTGDLLLSFLPLQREQVLQYPDLKPRPDTVWPISNLFLEDPVSLAFDCPLSHADYRMVIHAADGRVTLLPELIVPDDERQQNELLNRMRALIQAQARNAAGKPDRFDPHYLHLPMQQLPNYENLVSRDHFARHLTRLARTAVKPIELGAEVTVRQDGQQLWEVHVGSLYGEPDRSERHGASTAHPATGL
jgi:hypothetical protein